MVDLLPSRTFFQRDLTGFCVSQLSEAGIGFSLSFERLDKIDNEPYCQLVTTDGMMRLEIYIDSANIVSFFDGCEQSVCLETYQGHSAEAVAEDFKKALPQVLKGFGGLPPSGIDEAVSLQGVDGRWWKLLRR